MNLKLNKINQNKWFHNVQVFLAPVGVIYLGFVGFNIATEGHIISLRDFVPSNFVMGGIALYFVNSALDYLRKLRA